MIEFILSTVCIALDEKYVGWRETGLKILKDLTKFIERLIGKIDLIKEQGSKAISPNTLKLLSRNLKSEHFGKKKLETNIIAKPLGMWCLAIH